MVFFFGGVFVDCGDFSENYWKSKGDPIFERFPRKNAFILDIHVMHINFFLLAIISKNELSKPRRDRMEEEKFMLAHSKWQF
jgi:hypothetical protein